MIDVIIPAYNAHKTIEQTLVSIAYQDCADKLNVYIIDDCSDNDYSEFVDFYSKFINVKELRVKKNGGPALARQFGIDNSKSEFMVFIDSDDVFSDSCAISRLYNSIVENNSDISMSAFFEEYGDSFLHHGAVYVWMHGKMYRRKFLLDNNIRFNDTRANEDCGFNQLCFICGANYSEIGGITYIWRNNPSSITRVNSGEFGVKYMKFFTYNMIWAIEEAEKRNYEKQRFAETVFGALVSIYHFYLQNKELFEKEKIIEQVSVLTKYLDDHPVQDDVKLNIIKNQLNSESSGPDLLKVYNPSITFDDFINLLKSRADAI